MKPVPLFRLSLALFCLGTTVSGASILNVCSSGCRFSSVQEAVNRAQPGDVIELKAGERFVESVTIGANKSGITIRSSRYKELPGSGYRIQPAQDAALLATIASPATEPALRIGSEQNVVLQNGVDVATGRIRFDYATSFAVLREGAAIACYGREEFLARLPAPLVPSRQYFVRDWDAASRSGRLAASAQGPAIRLTDAGSAGQAYYYSRPACALWDQPHDIGIVGVRFEASRNKPTRNLVMVGHNAEADPVRMGPMRIRFEHDVITGAPENPNGPLICLALFGGHQLSVADSWIGHCKLYGDESKGIAIQNVNGLKITNNYIAAASINILTSGSDAARGEVNEHLEITGNFLEKPGYMMYKEGVGEPVGSCYYGGGSGAFYRRKDVDPNTCQNGACYTCSSSNTWIKAPQEVYRNQTYLNKNLIELKDCENCLIQGNMLRGSYVGPDGGQGWCFGVVAGVSKAGMSGFGSGYHRIHHTTFRDNHGDACYSGIFALNSSYGGSFRQIPIKDLTIENNLLTNYGWYPALSQFPNPQDSNRYGFKQSGGNQDVRITNNTIRGRPEGSYVGMTFFDGKYVPSTMNNYEFANNLIHYGKYAFLLDARSNDCTAAGLLGLLPRGSGKPIRNNVFYAGEATETFLESADCRASVAAKNFTVGDDRAVGFVSATDSRLKVTSPFSAGNKRPKALSDDGTDLGADIDLIEQYSIPAVKGIPSTTALIELEVVPEARKALLRYQRPEGVKACQVMLYAGPRLENALVADTRSVADQQDSRPSSTVKERRVQFTAGAVNQLLAGKDYSYRIQCGATRVIGRFRTLTEAK